MQYEPGQRVVLVRTSDPHTLLRPGDEGTVRRHDAGQRRIDVTWDNGSTLSMLLDDGDVITPAPIVAPSTGPADPASPAADGGVAWPKLLDALRIVGAADGTAAAERWLQDTIGGRASGDTAVTARRILNAIDDGIDDGIDDEDPAVLDTLPTIDANWSDSHTTGHGMSDGRGHATQLTREQLRQAEDAYRDGYTTAVTDTIAAACRRRLHPTGNDRDLSHLHPDNVTFGSVAVFSGDWNDAGVMAAHPLTAGYVGTLIDRWNGWAVHLREGGGGGDRRRPATGPRRLPCRPQPLDSRRGAREGPGPADRRGVLAPVVGRRRHRRGLCRHA
ncbi:DUF4314 domain-containing protein [Virgisporangium aurantiacum]|uniref:DUF4314 domain-containing protein n=1 Tax=Virgisporangium aurantiacum TaxID=175570 RepID=A0A8J3ZNZ6_9ACTN|nr:DUF4314 domain-containing protein [Virgisporangium aurantiacum]GIJ65031.1 hypothetical protein Vau01_125470 [Virgisporangium aurantiacum]